MMMEQTGLSENDCRHRCVGLWPSCEGYAFQRESGDCEVYKREDPPQHAVELDDTPGVLCYRQDDAAFDNTSNILRSTITVTHPDGSQSGVTRVMFCQTHVRQLQGSQHVLPVRSVHEDVATASLGQAVLSIADGFISRLTDAIFSNS